MPVSSNSKILIVAGEASGDMHAADLMKAVITQAQERGVPPPQFYGMGGTALREMGAAPLIGMEQVSVIGLFEVLRHLPQIWLIFRQLVRSLDREQPQLAILVDFPDFNLRLAKEIKRRGIPLIWYISPQLWAWRPQRVYDYKRLVDKMLVLFPFEVDFYCRYNMEVTWVGHPLVDRVKPQRNREDLRRELQISPEAHVVALLPGSRRSELKMYLEPMLKAAEILFEQQPGIRFVLPLAGSLNPRQVEPALTTCRVPVMCRSGMTYDLVHLADAAVVASGTATLETALIGTPMVILGRVSGLTELWLKQVANLPYYGLVNFVLGEAQIKELIQKDVTPHKIVTEVTRLLEDQAEQARLAACYQEIHRRLGEGGAAKRAGQAVLELLLKAGSGQ